MSRTLDKLGDLRSLFIDFAFFRLRHFGTELADFRPFPHSANHAAFRLRTAMRFGNAAVASARLGLVFVQSALRGVLYPVVGDELLLRTPIAVPFGQENKAVGSEIFFHAVPFPRSG